MIHPRSKVRRKPAYEKAASDNAGVSWYQMTRGKKQRKGKDWVDMELDKRIKKMGTKKVTKNKKMKKKY